MELIDNEFLLRHIEKFDLNYTELSRKTDISRGTLYNIVWGKNWPSYSVMNALADSLEFTQDEFIAIFFPTVKFKDKLPH